MKFTYLGKRVSSLEECEATVTARTRCGWVIIRESGALLHGSVCSVCISSKAEGAVHKSYVSPAMLCGSEA